MVSRGRKHEVEFDSASCKLWQELKFDFVIFAEISFG